MGSGFSAPRQWGERQWGGWAPQFASVSERVQTEHLCPVRSEGMGTVSRGCTLIPAVELCSAVTWRSSGSVMDRSTCARNSACVVVLVVLVVVGGEGAALCPDSRRRGSV